MAKAELKTKASEVSVAEFIASVPDAQRRKEAEAIDALHRRATGCEPKMWGPSIVGYGSYHYKYESGREGTMCRGGFSPRKAALTVYFMASFRNHQTEADALFARLGKHSLGKVCLYIKRLDHIDLVVLEELVALNWKCMNEVYPV